MPAQRQVKHNTEYIYSSEYPRKILILTCDLEKRVPLIRRHVLQAFQSQQIQDDLGLILLFPRPLVDILAERKLAIWATAGLDPGDWIVFVAHFFEDGRAPILNSILLDINGDRSIDIWVRSA